MAPALFHVSVCVYARVRRIGSDLFLNNDDHLAIIVTQNKRKMNIREATVGRGIKKASGHIFLTIFIYYSFG